MTRAGLTPQRQALLYLFQILLYSSPGQQQLLPPPFILTPVRLPNNQPNYQLEFPENITNPTWADLRDVILTEVAITCGTSRMCNTTGYDAYGLKASCSPCQKCFCDDLCVELGDCCIDKQIDDIIGDQYVKETTENTGNKLAECMDVRFKGLRQTSEKEYASLLLISSCPRHFKDSDVIARCQSSGTINKYLLHLNRTASDLAENWPVVSKTTSLPYKNRDCAKCNDDGHDLLPWQIKVSCGEDIVPPVTLNLRETFDYVLSRQDCEIAFAPPPAFPLRSCDFPLSQFNFETTGYCNATGKRHLYDEFLWKACQTLSTKFKRELILYDNVFCYRCQTDNYEYDSSICGYSGPFPFFLVMSPDALEMVQAARGCLCEFGYVYNPYKKKCIELHCPVLRKLSRDLECVPNVEGFYRRAYSINLRLDGVWSRNVTRRGWPAVFPQTDDDMFQTAEMLLNAFTEKLSSDPKDSSQVEVYPFNVRFDVSKVIENNKYRVFIFAKFVAKYNVEPSELENRLLQLNRDKWTIKISNEIELECSSQLIPKPHDVFLEMFVLQTVKTGFLEEFSGSSTSLTEMRLIQLSYVLFGSPFVSYYDVKYFTEVKNTLICPTFVYNLTIDDDVEIKDADGLDDGQVLIHNASGVQLSFLDFHVFDDDTVQVCARKIMDAMEKNTKDTEVDATDVFGAGLVITGAVCFILNAVCLFLTLVTYCIFPSLRTLPGKNTMGLVFTILMVSILFTAGGFFVDAPIACQIIGAAVHFFLISSFIWKLICTVHMYRVFSSITESRAEDKERKFKFLTNVVISIVIPAIVVMTTITTNYFLNLDDTPITFGDSDDNDDEGEMKGDGHVVRRDDDHCKTERTTYIGYGDGFCYLSNRLSFIIMGFVPLMAIVVINLGIFVLTIYAYRKMTTQEKMVRKEAQNHLYIYIKLSTLTGINWLPSLMSTFFPSEILWYAFLILCGLQGVYIFFSFVLNKRVLHLYASLCNGNSPSGSKYSSSDVIRAQQRLREAKKMNSNFDDVKTTSTRVDSNSLSVGSNDSNKSKGNKHNAC